MPKPPIKLYYDFPEVDYVQIGERIRTVRKGKNLTQQALADAINVSYTYVSHMEQEEGSQRKRTSKPSLGILSRVAWVLDISLDELIYGPPADKLLEDQNTIGRLLMGCTTEERQMICDVAAAVRNVLVEYRKEGGD